MSNQSRDDDNKNYMPSVTFAPNTANELSFDASNAPTIYTNSTSNQNKSSTLNSIPIETAGIPDYMIFSIVNIFLAGIVMGALAVFFSMHTKKHKKAGSVEAAKKWSRITLVFNIVITCISIAFIILIVVSIRHLR